MNPRETWLLAGTALAMIVFILAFERHWGRMAPAPAAPEPLLENFNAHRITSIEIRQPGQILEVERLNLQWRLNSPVYPARNSEIDQLLDEVGKLRRYSTISAREYLEQPGGLAAYGLDQPLISLSFRDGGKEPTVLAVGSKTLIGEQLYLQVNGAAEIVVSEAAWLDLVPASVMDWRSPRLVHQEQFYFDSLSISGSSGSFQAERAASRDWRLIRPLRARADAHRIEELAEIFRRGRVEVFVADGAQADLEEFGLKTPRAFIRLAEKQQPVFEIEFGRTNAAGQVYARLPGHDNVVLVPRELLDEAQRPYTWYRDRGLINFDPDEISRVEWVGEWQAALARRNGLWQILEPYVAPADEELVQQFFRDLLQLEVVEFTKDVVTDFSGYGLTPPARSYSLYRALSSGQTNNPHLQVDLSSNQLDPTRVDRVFARRSDENSVYTISFGDVLRLADHPYRLRERRIWNFDSKEISRVTINHRGGSSTLTRRGGWSGDEIINASMEETFYRLSTLRAIEWVARGEDRLRFYGFPEVDFSVILEAQRGGKEEIHEIRFGSLSRGGHPYAAVRMEGELVVFTFPAAVFEMVARDLAVPGVIH
jgi:hypothetical protein